MMSTMEGLAKAVAAYPSQDLAIEALLAGLADRIKATSNDRGDRPSPGAKHEASHLRSASTR